MTEVSVCLCAESKTANPKETQNVRVKKFLFSSRGLLPSKKPSELPRACAGSERECPSPPGDPGAELHTEPEDFTTFLQSHTQAQAESRSNLQGPKESTLSAAIKAPLSRSTCDAGSLQGHSDIGTLWFPWSVFLTPPPKIPELTPLGSMTLWKKSSFFLAVWWKDGQCLHRGPGGFFMPTGPCS